MSKKSKKKLKLKKDYSLLLQESGLAPKTKEVKKETVGAKIAASQNESIVDLTLIRKDLLLSLYTFLGVLSLIIALKILALKVISIEDLGNRLFRLLNIG